MQSHCKKLARYNLWAYEQVFASLDQLSDEQYHSHCQVMFRSIHGVMGHLYEAEQVWISRFTTGVTSPLLDHWKVPYAKPEDESHVFEKYSREEIKQLLRSSAQSLIDYVNGLTEEQLNGTYTFTRYDQTMTLPLCDSLLHLVNHGTHHRGQITALLSQKGLNPPVVDYFIYTMPQWHPKNK
ncbi:hypothetical protein EDD86DRAFT_244673 [Gorgonomyces haynaldii]|nr:hypothetical protein EDD86DRAFT_244673 [Gorgonomyces haynaldii]